MSYDKKARIALAHEGASIAQSISSISSQVELDHASSTVPPTFSALQRPPSARLQTPALSPLESSLDRRNSCNDRSSIPRAGLGAFFFFFDPQTCYFSFLLIGDGLVPRDVGRK